MKTKLVYVIPLLLLLVGCTKGPAGPAANGEGNTGVTPDALLPYQGPAGGGNEIEDDPVTPASGLPDGTTKSAFPKTDPPGQSVQMKDLQVDGEKTPAP